MKDKIVNKLETTWYNIKYGLVNIIKWMPIVWNDRDWDHYYLLKILEFKLLKMEKLFRKYGNHMSSDKQARQLKKCSEIFKRLYKDEYQEESFMMHDKKWGDLNVEFKEVSEDLSEIIFRRKNALTKKDKINEKHESKICIKKGYEKQMTDLKDGFRIMQDNILSWWD